jgi:hypothetical protein
MAVDFLEKTLPVITSPEIGFVFSGIDTGEIKDNIINTTKWKLISGVYPSKMYIHDALFTNHCPVSPGAAIFRIADLRANLVLNLSSPELPEFNSHGAGPDLLLYLLTATRYQKIGYISESLTFFRAHPGSLSIQFPEKLRSYYFQSKIWFAKNYCKRAKLDALLIRGWLKEIGARKFKSFYAYSEGRDIEPKSLLSTMYRIVNAGLLTATIGEFSIFYFN